MHYIMLYALYFSGSKLNNTKYMSYLQYTIYCVRIIKNII